MFEIFFQWGRSREGLAAGARDEGEGNACAGGRVEVQRCGNTRGVIPKRPKTKMRDFQKSVLAEALVEMDRRVGSSNPSIEAQLVRNRLHK